MRREIKEALRYLGYKGEVDAYALQRVEACYDELKGYTSFRIVSQIFPVEFEETVNIGPLSISSKDLRKNLSGCKQVVVLACTLGVGVDRWIERLALTDIAKAAMAQACAASLIEEELDAYQELHGWKHPRFSAGYGDCSILYQKDILFLLDAPKKIGLSLTKSFMMVPTKSVTAFIGIGNGNMEKHSCANCKLDCLYRKEEQGC